MFHTPHDEAQAREKTLLNFPLNSTISEHKLENGLAVSVTRLTLF